MKFKIGDKVRVIKGLTEYNTGIEREELKELYLNNNFIVEDIEGNGDLYVKWLDKEYGYWFEENQLELITINEPVKYKSRGFEFVSAEQLQHDTEIDNLDELEKTFKLKLPKRGTSKSAGYDIFAPYDIILQPNEEIKVPTGLKAYMQDGEVLMAFPRSGLGFKYYCRLANTIAVIDSDYYNNPNNEGHIFIKLRNEGAKEMVIKQGDGMCQMIFMPFLLVDGDSFNNGEERKGGFGSTTK